MKFQLGAMSGGDILDRGLKILFARLGTFFAINLILQMPLLAMTLIIPFMPRELAQIPTLIMLLLLFIVIPVSTGATIQVIAKEYVDERVSAGPAIAFAFRWFGGLLGTSLLAGLIIAVGSILIIPGIIFYVMYALVSQVVVVEGLSGTAALSRSAELTSGFRGRILGILLLVIFLLVILQLAIALGVSVLLPPGGIVLTSSGFVEQPYNHPNYEINQVVAFLVDVVATAYGIICLTLVYFDLRVRKEGFDLEVATRQQLTPQ